MKIDSMKINFAVDGLLLGIDEVAKV